MSLALITVSFDPPVLGTQKNAAFSVKVDQMFGTDLPLWTEQANALAASLVDVASAANYSSNSETEHDIGTGEKTFEIDSGKIYVPGQFITVVNTAAPENGMYCRVESHDLVAGTLELTSLRVYGSGAGITAWSIGLSGPQGEGGDVLPDFAGKGRYRVRVKEDETFVEYVPDGWVQLGTIPAASLSGQSTVSFTGIDADEYPKLMMVGSFTPSTAANVGITVGDGVDTEYIGAASSLSGACSIGAIIEKADTAFPMARTSIHVQIDQNYEIDGRVVHSVAPVTTLNVFLSTGTFNNAGGLTLYGEHR